MALCLLLLPWPLLLLLLQAPRDKLVCVLNCCSMINAQLAKSAKEGIGEAQ
jgi:hypothetical protein